MFKPTPSDRRGGDAGVGSESSIDESCARLQIKQQPRQLVAALFHAPVTLLVDHLGHLGLMYAVENVKYFFLACLVPLLTQFIQTL